MSSNQLSEISNRIINIAKTSLQRSDCDNYDNERYNEIITIAGRLKKIAENELTENTINSNIFNVNYMLKDEPITKKADVRAIIFNEKDEILLVQELDGTWAPPGGWADVGYSIKEVAIKETLE